MKEEYMVFAGIGECVRNEVYGDQDYQTLTVV